MHLRFGTAILAATLLTAGMAFPATAATEAWMASPSDGNVVRDRVTLLVNVSETAIEQVSLRLSEDGIGPTGGTASIPLPCVDNCDGEGTSKWGDRTFDPIGGAPFSSAGVCNGEWTFQGKLDNRQWFNLATVTFSAPPVAPKGLTGTSGDGFNEVSWTMSKTPDVLGYRLERSTGASWLTIASVDKRTTTARDETVAPGREYRYRVVALRPDGFVEGKPSVPCMDRGLDLETPSSEIQLRNGADSPTEPNTDPTTSPTKPSEPTSPGSGSSGSGSSGSGSSGSGTSGSGSDGGSPSGSPSGADSGSDGSTSDDDSSTSDPDGSSGSSGSAGSSSSPRSPARPVAPPPRPSRQTDTRVTAPSLGGGGEAQESYYGEGEEFGEIDYDGAEPIVGESELVGYDEDGKPIYRVVAGGFEDSAIQILDASKLRVLALGLLFVALAMHGRRWLNATA